MPAKHKPDAKKGEKAFQGKPRLTKEDREARQGMMLVQKLTGHTIPNIAKMFGVKTSTVYEELAEAQKKQLHQKAVSFITQSLMPKALGVFQAALELGDKEIAIRVIEGLGILGRGGAAGLQVNIGSDPSVESFEAYRLRISRIVAGKAEPPVFAPEGVDGGGLLPDPGAVQEGETVDGAGGDAGDLEDKVNKDEGVH